MKIVIQRISEASVTVRGEKKASIKKGLLLLAGIDEKDTEAVIKWGVKKVLNMRIFQDDRGKMDKSVRDIEGAVLIVPNFTLCANTKKGNRPSFAKAADPEKAKKLYERMIEYFRQKSSLTIESGIFGADMDVKLLNDGPVTIILEKNQG